MPCPDILGEIIDLSKGFDLTQYSLERVNGTYALISVPDPDNSSENIIQYDRRAVDPLLFSGYRSEIRMRRGAEIGETWFYEFQVRFPSNSWGQDSTETSIFQVHVFNPNLGFGLSPPIAFLVDKDLNIRAQLRGDDRGNDMPSNNPQVFSNYSLGTLSYDTWIKFQMKVIWKVDSNGLVEIKKDGVLVATHNDKIGYNMGVKHSAKAGIYKFAVAPTFDYVVQQKGYKFGKLVS